MAAIALVVKVHPSRSLHFRVRLHIQESLRSCQLTAWRSGVDAALEEGLTPLLLCPDTVHSELMALMAADASVRVVDVKPLSPSGVRTKVPLLHSLCSRPCR